jgi:GT2 family glycosyltransferase
MGVDCVQIFKYFPVFGGQRVKDGKEVCTIIWTYNPSIRLLKIVVRQAVKNTDFVLIIDNGSRNKDEIEKISKIFPDKVDGVYLSKNLGVEALNIGISCLMKKYDCKWILILDDDTILRDSSIDLVLRLYNRLKISRDIKEKICIISLTDLNTISFRIKRMKATNTFVMHNEPVIFSGTLVNVKVLKKLNVKIDGNLFLHHADTDFFIRLSRRGCVSMVYMSPLLIHREGLPLFKPIRLLFFNFYSVSAPYTIYYTIRNGFYLFIRNRIPILDFCTATIHHVVPSLIFNFKETLKVTILGIAHGIVGRLGYLEIEQLSDRIPSSVNNSTK